MPIKLTEKQLELLIGAIRHRISELNDIINPLLSELEEHERFLAEHEQEQLPGFERNIFSQSFELLPWSKKIIMVLFETGHAMTANEIVAEIISRIPGLAEEASTRSSVASILSRRSGKLFKKVGDKYGLIEWRINKFKS
ncbi:MAG TPA: hypothetical protein VGD22_12125 [Sphingobacteriaceae bacterium]